MEPNTQHHTLRRILLLAGTFLAAWVIAYALTPYSPVTPARVAVLAVLIYICGYLYSKTRSSALAGITAVLFFSAFLWIAHYLRDVTGPNDTSEAERAAKRIAIRQQVEETARKRLTSVGWVDQAKAIAHIPLTDAMTLEIEALKKKPVRAANPIAMPPAVAAPAPAKTETKAPAAPAKPAAAKPVAPAPAPPTQP